MSTLHLKPITQKVLQRPEYTSTRAISRDAWLRDNDDSIRDWYRQTSEAAPEEHFADFYEFSLVQYDIAVDLDQRLTDGLYEAELRESDAEDEA